MGGGLVLSLMIFCFVKQRNLKNWKFRSQDASLLSSSLPAPTDDNKHISPAAAAKEVEICNPAPTDDNNAFPLTPPLKGQRFVILLPRTTTHPSCRRR